MSLTLAGAGFAVGLLGGVHCAAMCGGFAMALAQSGPGGRPAWRQQGWLACGRIGSYTAAGAVAGSLGGAGLLAADILPVQALLYAFANLLLIGIGLHLAGLSSAITWLEQPGRWLWHRLQPWLGRCLPADTPTKALAAGALWGWLPCGLVYTMLATATLAGSASGGAGVMAAFGLGTLPNVLGAGLVLGGMRRGLRAAWIRVLAGATVAGFGIFGLAQAAPLAARLEQGLLCLS